MARSLGSMPRGSAGVPNEVSSRKEQGPIPRGRTIHDSGEETEAIG